MQTALALLPIEAAIMPNYTGLHKIFTTTEEIMGTKALLRTALLAALSVWGASAGAQISNDVVKIGILTDMSGPYSGMGGVGSVVAAKMAVEDCLKAECKGMKIEVLSADHQNKADLGATKAREWIDTEHVDALADLTNSSVALAVQKLAKEKGVVAMFSGPATTKLTTEECSPVGFHWMFDTYSQAVGTAAALTKLGNKSWYFLTVDYAFGHSLEKDAGDVVKDLGGGISGAVRHPLNASDLSSFLIQAKNSKAQVLGLANGGQDTVNSIKQAVEFGLTSNGATFAAYVLFLEHVQSITLNAAQGLLLANPFYWDLNDETRAWSKRFEEKIGHPPDWDPAMAYSAVFHYLKAVKAAGTRDADAVAAKMREIPVNDFATKDGKVRLDGRVIRNLYLLQVKKPGESKSKWDIYNVVTTVPGEQAFRPLDQGGCPLVNAASGKQ